MQPRGQPRWFSEEHRTPSKTNGMLGNLAGSQGRGKLVLLPDMNLEKERLLSLQGRTVFENGSDAEDGEPRGRERSQGLEKETA